MNENNSNLTSHGSDVTNIYKNLKDDRFENSHNNNLEHESSDLISIDYKNLKDEHFDDNTNNPDHESSDLMSLYNFTNPSEIVENNLFDYTPNSNLFYYVKRKDLKTIKAVLKYPAYSKDYEGNNLLQLACKEGCYEIVEYLLSIEFDVNNNIIDNNGNSIFYYCFNQDYIDILILLINHKINVHFKDSNYGRSALHDAAEFNQLNILKYFIDNNIYDDIYDVDNDGNNILHIACLANNYDIIEYLLSIGYNVNTTTYNNESALHLSIDIQNIQIINLLLNSNINIYVRTLTNGRLALHSGSEFNHLNILKYFIDNNIYENIYDIDKDGNNILHIACMKSNYEIVDYLLLNGYNISITNYQNRSALHHSIDGGNINIINLLLTYNIDINIKDSIIGRSALHVASDFNQLNILKYFIDNNIFNNIYDVDNYGNNILHIACGRGNYNIIQYLLSIGYDLNISNYENRSALHYCVMEGHLRIVTLLVLHGINVYIKEIKEGRSAFHYASEYNQLDILKYFIDNNIYDNIYDIDNDGNNILHIACQKANYNIVEYLLSIRYVVDITNDNNQTAVMICQDNNSYDLVDLICFTT